MIKFIKIYSTLEYKSKNKCCCLKILIVSTKLLYIIFSSILCILAIRPQLCNHSLLKYEIHPIVSAESNQYTQRLFTNTDHTYRQNTFTLNQHKQSRITELHRSRNPNYNINSTIIIKTTDFKLRNMSRSSTHLFERAFPDGCIVYIVLY